jgi:opacity protein-like surface antigen
MLKFFLLAAIASAACSAQAISVGIRGGVPLSNGFASFTEPGTTIRIDSESKLYVIGPMLEVHLPLGFSVEGDALYHPLSQRTSTSTNATSENISSWEFPVLAKYHFSFPVIKPLIEAGPEFRHIRLGYFSNTGFTFGAGVEVKLGRLRIEPELRYTRWGGDAAPGLGVLFNAPSQLNQGVFLIGVTF